MTEQWLATLIEDCKDIAVETEFASKWALVEGRHQLGCRVLSDSDRFDSETDIVQCIAQGIGRHKRTVYYSIQFARMFPDLNLLPEGKNLSWTHIINKYLTSETDKLKRPTVASLIGMIRAIKQLLDTELARYHQEEVLMLRSDYQYKTTLLIVSFIRSLQDQVTKIVGEL